MMAVQIIWWIGLIVALVLTLVILKQVVLLVRVLRQIDGLARHTSVAAASVAENVDAGAQLGEFRDSVRELADTVQTVAASFGRLSSVAEGIPRRNPSPG